MQHFVVRPYSENAQKTSKPGENISGSWCTSLFSPCFDVICALSEYRRTAKWNLFVNKQNINSIDMALYVEVSFS